MYNQSSGNDTGDEDDNNGDCDGDCQFQIHNAINLMALCVMSDTKLSQVWGHPKDQDETWGNQVNTNMNNKCDISNLDELTDGNDGPSNSRHSHSLRKEIQKQMNEILWKKIFDWLDDD